MSFDKLMEGTPHRQFGLPSLFESMIPAKVKTIPARLANQPITTPIDDGTGAKKASASDYMRRRRSSTILAGGPIDPATDGGASLYTTTIG